MSQGSYNYRSSYSISEFKGLNEMTSEGRMSPSYSPDCMNMDTENGDLAVGKGYSKHISTKVPSTDTIWCMHYWHTLANDKFVVAAGNNLYAWNGASWDTIYTFTTTITSKQWDFTECRIGNTDYLVISNGQTQMVKWTGTGSAELFGTGEYIYTSTVASVTYNMDKATSVTYASADNVGTYTLTVSGFTFASGKQIAFQIPTNIGTVTSCNISIDGTTYPTTYVPVWSSGDDVVITAVVDDGTNKFAPSEDDVKYGISKVELTAALDSSQQSRATVVGIQIDGITYKVTSFESDNKTAVLEEVCTTEIETGVDAKVRGGISNIATNYTEMYYSRMFAAGDSDHPSRLYWSQPPGDTRTIEDWSMDDASDTTGGGYVDVGYTSNDPIVGLCALSSQLLVFKKSSIYRVLGDRPSNYRVVIVSASVENMTNTGRVSYGDVPYWITKAGMYYHNGQSSLITSDARLIKDTLEKADISSCKSAQNRNRLYFTCKLGSGTYDDTIIVYDMIEKTYMLRNGFNVIDLCAYSGNLYMINDSRYIYIWDDSTTYDGVQIDAYWNTPLTDLSTKTVTKACKWLYLRGSGGIVQIRYKIGEFAISNAYQMPSDEGTILRIPMLNEGKVISFKLFNEAGSHFKILGGIEVVYEIKRDD